MIKTCLQIIVLLYIMPTNGQTNAPQTFLYPHPDSATTSLSSQYEAGILQRLFMGKNYRTTWEMPVKLPVFHLSQTQLHLIELGGGRQTKSLRLKEDTGKEWVLRTVDKDVSGAVKKAFRNLGMKNLMQDMISALYPYSQVITAQLVKADHIAAASPQLFWVAEDKAFGKYLPLFAGKVCSLEEREPTPDGSPTQTTEEMMEELKKRNDCRVLQKQVLRARLLDMLIGDWDRHADNWQWGAIDSAGTRYYYAIPKDRDNALFYSDGLLLRLFHHTVWPFYIGFTRKSFHLKKLNYKAWEFDQAFLNELDAATWQQAIENLQKTISDSVIQASVQTLPPSVHASDAPQLVAKLKSRRDGLLKSALQYYQYLSAVVTINGTDEEELFVVSGKDNQILVTVYNKEKPGQKIYERLFDPAVTYEIRLNGRGGHDHFITEKSARSKIRLRISGNKGDDIYEMEGSLKTRVVDARAEKNVIRNNASARLSVR